MRGKAIKSGRESKHKSKADQLSSKLTKKASTSFKAPSSSSLRFKKTSASSPKKIPINDVQGELSDLDDSDDSSYELVDEDDECDNDLFTENVDFDLDVHVCSKDVQDELDTEFREERARDVYVCNEDEENESEDELEELDENNEGRRKYPVFNPNIDFRGNVTLSFELKFPDKKVFRKALRHHAIENGYNYYYLHNSSKRIMVYCFNKCSCVKKKTKFVKCTCSSENKCNFKVYAVKIRDEETFQIRSLNVVHNLRPSTSK